MLVAITGATGFLGRYIVNHLLGQGHHCRCWYRPESDRGGFLTPADPLQLQWHSGELEDAKTTDELVQGADAVIHAALHRPVPGSRRAHAEPDLVHFAQKNLMGSLRLFEAARLAKVQRLVFISSCAVHEVILEDRPLDEAHPLWPTSHYGAYKAAVEKFVHSFGLGQGWNICALRPTGIYGLARPLPKSRYYPLVREVLEGKPIQSNRGGKEVHAADVAKAIGLLLAADPAQTAGRAFNCYDHYIAEQEVAQIAREISGSPSAISMLNQGPKHQIQTLKLRNLGMSFGGKALLTQTVTELVAAIRQEQGKK